MPEIEFWYEFASPYAYLAASRIDGLAAARGLRVLWRPLLLGPIFKRRTKGAAAFQNAGAEQDRYRRRDVERLCAWAGLSLTWPSVYPRGSLLAARVALIAANEGWCADFSRAVYHASFAEDLPIGESPVIAAIIDALGRPSDAVLAAAESPENKARLIAQVETAVAQGIFGAPSFVVNGELFWGNDRLEQALDWAERPWLTAR